MARQLALGARTLRVPVRVHSMLQIPKLRPEVLASVQKLFEHPNPDYAKKQRLGHWIGNTPKTVSSWVLEEDGGISVPRGARGKLEKALAPHHLVPKYIDERLDTGEIVIPVGPGAQPLESRDYQEELVAAILAAETCLIRAATGAGKSEVVIAAVQRARRQALVIVWSAGLLDQWVDRIAMRLGWRTKDVGVIQSSKRKIAPITVGMQQSLWKCGEDVANKFGFVVLDEAQRAAAKTVRETINMFPARWRLAVTADERRKDRQDFLTHDAFGELAGEVTREELVASGALCEVDIVAVPTELHFAQIEEAASDDRGRVVGQLWGALIDKIVADVDRNRLIVELAAAQARAGHHVLVFTERVDHCVALSKAISLDQRIPCGTFLGGADNRAVYEETRARLSAGEIQVAVGTSCVYQGVDIPRLDVGIVATPTATNKQLLEQQVGRLRRRFPGKERGTLFYVWDSHVLPSHVAALRRFYGKDLVRVLDE